MKKNLLFLGLILSLLLCACSQQTVPAEAADVPVPSEQVLSGPDSSVPAEPVTPPADDLPPAETNTPSAFVPRIPPASSRSTEAKRILPDSPLKSAPAETQTIDQKSSPVYPRQSGQNTAQNTPQNTAPQTTPQFVRETVPQDTPKLPQDTTPVSPPADMGKCTISILCSTAIGKSDAVPPSGRFLSTTAVTLSGGETVYDILYAVCKANDIPLGGNSGYIKSIGGLAERDCGGGSGWLYRVNGESPNVSCGNYKIFDGDRIEWIYTCEMGNDL